MGLFDLRSMYGATEELWFPEWDLKGQPWNSDQIRKILAFLLREEFQDALPGHFRRARLSRPLHSVTADVHLAAENECPFPADRLFRTPATGPVGMKWRCTTPRTSNGSISISEETRHPGPRNNSCATPSSTRRRVSGSSNAWPRLPALRTDGRQTLPYRIR